EPRFQHLHKDRNLRRSARSDHHVDVVWRETDIVQQGIQISFNGGVFASDDRLKVGAVYRLVNLESFSFQFNLGAGLLGKQALGVFHNVVHLQAVTAGDQIAQGANLVRALGGSLDSLDVCQWFRAWQREEFLPIGERFVNRAWNGQTLAC